MLGLVVLNNELRMSLCGNIVKIVYITLAQLLYVTYMMFLQIR